MEAQIPAFGLLSTFFSMGTLGLASLAPKVALNRYFGSGGNSEPKFALNQKSSTRKAAGYVRDEREPARRSKQYITARERESALVFTKCERTA
jgi:hypothetical protein